MRLVCQSHPCFADLGGACVPGVGGRAAADGAGTDQPLPRRSRIPAARRPAAAKDVPVKDPAHPQLAEVMETVGHNKIAINMVWTLIAGFLVMFMQAGFALVETGFTRAKNVAHTMTMNFMVYAIGMFGYWVCGYALQMGGVGAVATLGGDAGPQPRVHGLALRQDLRPVRHEGVLPERRHLRRRRVRAVPVPDGLHGYGGHDPDRCDGRAVEVVLVRRVLVLSSRCSSIPIFGNWVWGGGWLSQLGANFGLGHGHVDFAGSSVVHLVGGMAALAGAIVIGPRIGKYNKDGTREPDSRAQPADGHRRHVHPGVRLVRLQRRLVARRHRPAHRALPR